MSKKNKGGLVYSTNPNFKPEEEPEETEHTVKPSQEQLKIYWTSATENKILKNLEQKLNKNDANLLREKFKLNLNCILSLIKP